MPTVKGNLLFVSSRAAQVSEVWVRAPRVRTHLEGVVTTGNDRFPVKDGEVSFTAVPGPAVLALISQGRAVDTIPILVGDAATQTLRKVVSAAKIADDATKREIEKLAAQAVELVDSSTANARKAQDGASRAETAAGNAKKSETSAEDAARRASNSSTSANRSSVWVSEAEQRAEKSASSAKADADRVANIANSTSWNGDRLTVNGKTSPSLTGPRGEQGEQGPPGTIEAADAPPVMIDMLSYLRSEASAEEITLSVIGTTATLSFTALVAPNSWTYITSKNMPKQYAPQRELRGAALAVKGDDVASLIVSPSGGLTAYSFVSGTEYTGSVTWAVPGPGGPAGEVTKAQLDTAVASEKARTVGVTWTVPRESGVAAKASAAQTGDYIQVAQPHTIYRVTSSGVEVERYGTRTLQASTDATSNRNPNQWLDNDDPWAGVNWSRVSPPAGKWLIELINPHDFAADLYVEGSKVTTVTSGTAAYTAEFSTAAKSDVYVQIPGDNHYKPITLRFTPIN